MSDDNTTPPAEQFQDNAGSHWPPHDRPRVWLLTDGQSPIAVALARKLLEHGDSVVAGLTRSSVEEEWDSEDDLAALRAELKEHGIAQGRLKTVTFDIRSTSEVQSAVSTVVQIFGRLDVLLCCNSEGISGD